MLTEKEKEWLERRKVYFKYYCRHCQFFKPYDAPHVIPGYCQGYSWCCPVNAKDFLSSMQDAAEFEARVAEKLAIDRATGKHLRPKGCSWYETAKDGQRIRQTACPPHHDIDKCAGFATCSLYHARLAAEAEMDNTAGSK